MYKLVIFDLDGTILNTLDDLMDSVNYVLKKLSYPIRTKEEIKSFLGGGVLKLIEKSLPDNKTKKELDEAYNLFIDYYHENSMNKTIPYFGIQKLLMELKDRKIITAVVSNKIDSAVQKMCQKYFDKLFKYVYGEKREFLKKPDPGVVLDIIKKEQVALSDVLYVGDSEVDYYTASNANIDCALVTWGFRDKEFLEKFDNVSIIDETSQLFKLITK